MLNIWMIWCLANHFCSLGCHTIPPFMPCSPTTLSYILLKLLGGEPEPVLGPASLWDLLFWLCLHCLCFISSFPEQCSVALGITALQTLHSHLTVCVEWWSWLATAQLDARLLAVSQLNQPNHTFFQLSLYTPIPLFLLPSAIVVLKTPTRRWWRELPFPPETGSWCQASGGTSHYTRRVEKPPTTNQGVHWCDSKHAPK